MSGIRWNEAQRRAIEDEGGALLVNAAAGSGKTAVLVERAVRLITREEAPVPADRLLILTFTNAAAEELRGRIALRLEQVLRQRADSFELRRQRMLLRRAFIGTIDAFCQQLVREHFTALDLPPDVAVAEPALLEVLGASALAETMEEMYEDPGFAAFTALYGRARSDKNAEDAVLALYDYTVTLPDARRRLEGYAAMYADGMPLAQTAWGEALMAHAARALEEAAGLAGQALEMACRVGPLAPCAEVLKADLAGLATVQVALNAGDWDGAKGALEAVAFRPFRPGRAGSEAEEAAIAAARGLRETVKDIVDELCRYTFVCTAAEFEADRTTAGPMVAALCQAVLLYKRNYDEAKRAERVLDFSDFEQLALALLQNEEGERSALARRVSARYDMVMVDEYQDTNELQSALYECLGEADGGNLFYVGDAKQSIYRFRRANPGIFLRKMHEWHPHASGRHPAHIALGHNYRSAPGVIAGVNWLFERLMDPELGEIAYVGEERLIAGREAKVPGGLEVRIVEGDGPEAEAAWVARRIGEMVARGTPVWEGDAPRPCGYGDFCILMRAGARMPVFVAALAAQGIPAAAGGGDALLQTPEVLPLAAALAAIDNPGDDISLAAAMLGPLFRFTPEELTKLRAERFTGQLWGAVAASRQPKVVSFAAKMAEYRALALALPVGRLCEVLVQQTGYLSAVAAMPGGAARRENVHRFIGWAAAVSRHGRGGLAGFVRLCQNTGGPEGAAAKTLPGHVNLLTIHKSKGLEFPFVFLCDARRRFNTRDLGDKVQMHAELGLGLTLRTANVLYRSLPASAIRGRLQKETLSEEMRLLYVALTRAKQRVVVSFATKDPQKLLAEKAVYQQGCPGAFMLARQSSMADWLLTALASHGASNEVFAGAGLPVASKPAGEDCFEISIEQAPRAEGGETEAYRLTAAPDEGLRSRLAAGFTKVPGRQALAGVPAKLSVSAIAKPGVPGVRKRPSFMYTGGLSAAEKGTAQHSFMQFASFAAARANPAGEVERLVAAGYLGAEAAKAVDLEGVRAFFASALWGRIEKAKRVLREYDFITALPAGELQPQLPAEYAGEPVLVQGIADLVLVGEDGIEIVDYKTDRVKDADELAGRYTEQLALYAEAVRRRLGQKVVRLTLWSFALGREVPVP